MIQFDDATRPQIEAANPGVSSWVSANAGSGKTKVLTDRVARLLLAGTPPSNILCLTFTKAAAANMQVRLFENLGTWSLLPESELRNVLLRLGESEETLTAEKFRLARTLFAQALETPGGLKIQTIHAFSSALLRMFPREAGVSPHFKEIDERGAKRLQNTVLELVATEQGEIFDDFAKLANGRVLEVVNEILEHRKSFEEIDSEATIWAAFDFPKNFDVRDLARELFAMPDREMLSSLRHAVANTPSSTNNRVLDFIDNADLESPDIKDIHLAERTFLTQKGEVRKTIVTRPAYNKLRDIDQTRLDAWACKLAEIRERRLKAECAQSSIILLRFAKAFLTAYESVKQRESSLDFDDLILKALAVLTRTESCDWVMYKLDGRIDHILVDESQDVNPAQWDIVARLAEEFTSGFGAREPLARTVFAVSDEKQSIFGFQGARPEKFAQMHEHFKIAHDDAEKSFQRKELLYSFRSASSILDLVDRVFATLDISESATNIAHRPFKPDMPGRVDLWPFIEAAEKPVENVWHSPENRAAPESIDAKLAKAVAKFVSESIRTKSPLPCDSGARPVRPRDFLILVQSRTGIFHAIIRELKKNGLPIAGTDRLKIAEELAVKDLTGILAFLATPADDFSLACVLRSPLCGLTESQLFSLAHSRGKKSLWAALAEQREIHREVVELLEDLLSQAQTAKPYELLEAVLTAHEGREKIISRMGAEVEEAIDAFLLQSLRYEISEPPSLTGFLEWLAADEMDVKRELDQSGDEIRVMTVHGAKGLESPIVILPQTEFRRISISNRILVAPNDIPVWKPATNEMPELLLRLREVYIERERQERRRLLYVAMTRAENWLVACGAGTKNDECWYELVRGGISEADSSTHRFNQLDTFFGGIAQGRRLSNGTWPTLDAPSAADTQKESEIALPEWTRRPASVPRMPERPLPPSGLGGEKSMVFDLPPADAVGSNEGALKRGSFIHLLLEHLPEARKDKRREVANNLRLRIEEELSDDEFEECLESCSLMLGDPELQFLFSGNALAEVAITARPPSLGHQPIYGFIDLLVVEPERVLAVDFKTNAVVPKRAEEVPEAILRQMGAYLESLELIYPGRRAETAILWTKNSQLMPLGRDSVVSALERAADEIAARG
ncbi:MAG: double-strand break repair helicase AddA [Albidovulum sp.]|nr:double-strand break repair helicase AddA [Albidovulum sp.]